MMLKGWGLGTCVLTLALLLGSCRQQAEIIHVTAEGPRPTIAEIDEDPWSLLPPGAIAWWRTDAQVFKSDLADPLVALFRKYAPLSADAPLDAKQDIDLVVGGLYATVGSDFVVICQGRFSPQGLLETVTKGSQTPSGSEIIIARFAGATMFVSQQIGLSVLSEKTMVLGTQLGVRRVLEVIEGRRMKRNLPPWYEALLENDSASFHLGIDLDAQPVPAVFQTKLTYMNHLRAARLVGNFEKPGLNFAGSLSFSTPHAASEAELAVASSAEKLEMYEGLLRTFGIRQPVHKLEALSTGKDTQVVAEIDAAELVALIEKSHEIFGEIEIEQWLPN